MTPFRRGLDITVVEDATCVFEPAGPGDYEQHQQAALDYLRSFYAADVVGFRALIGR
jgi:hypothetical protein